MKLTFIGHACFLVESDAGLRILLDPYLPGTFGGKMGLRPFLEPVDIVVSSHEHLDHNYVDPAFGTPEIVKSATRVRGIQFRGVRLPHDDEEGMSRGWVTGFRFEVDGISVVHPGDLGRPPHPAEAAALAPVDVLLLPVGGTFTMGPAAAVRAVEALRPRVVIPMHYRWPTVDLPLLPVEDFLIQANARHWLVERMPPQPLTLCRADLSPTPHVFVLSPTH